MSRNYRIAITGPESSGKSTLAALLAKHYQTVWVAEYARTYIEQLDRPYTEEDLLIIAKGQIALENKLAASANTLLFCDTEMTVLKIWGNVKYKRSHPWILEQWDKQNYDLILLMQPDLPWEEDPQREHPHFREELFDIYKKELAKQTCKVVVINGEPQERIAKAIKEVDMIVNIK